MNLLYKEGKLEHDIKADSLPFKPSIQTAAPNSHLIV